MKISGTRTKYPLKMTTLVLPLYAVSLLLPTLIIRENRISTEIPLNITALGIPFASLLFAPLFLMIIYAVWNNKFSEKHIPGLAAALGILLPLLVMAEYGSQAALKLGTFARYSPSGGFYISIIASLVIYLMKPKLEWSDYLGISIVIIITILMYSSGIFNRMGMVLEAKNLGPRLYNETIAHIRLTTISIGISVIIGIPIAFASYQSSRLKKMVFPILNVLQTIPGIALFGLLIAPLAALSQAFPVLRSWGIKGIGNTPAIIALSMYALYPIIRYSFTAFSSIESSVILAAKGIGMSQKQVWKLVRFPLSTPGVLHGVRVAMVQTIGNATLAKLIGGDGLGVLVFEGLGQASVDMVLLGMLLIIALTLASDRIFQIAIFFLTPKALRRGK
ncbi:ABC transporter permease [Pleomorphochaeta sp. DL1XJH-081]|uniref:ABC transporter permease n=1 Tax=Pleomorphochaeta sp. DL1XJH-081 TaxID=3409690 RepID=UPI003BB612C2